MSQLNELINKTIHAIQFNGCTLPESILRLQLENIVACAQLEESMRSNQRFLDSIGTAYGNGGNDRPNVIGDLITEPSLTPEQMMQGEWYVVEMFWNWMIKHEYVDSNTTRVYHSECVDLDNKKISTKGFFLSGGFKKIRLATKEEVLKYFPDETFGEPEQVGRWYQYLGDISPNFTPYNWYFCPTNNPYQESAFLDKHGEPNGFNPKNSECFDLTNPQLNNPDELVK